MVQALNAATSDDWDFCAADGVPKAPKIIYNRGKFSATAPSESSFQRLTGAYGDNAFDGRYMASILASKQIPEMKFLVVSYHGRHNNKGKTLTDDGIDIGAASDSKCFREATSFVSQVGKAVAKLQMPALVGGDWNAWLQNYKRRVVPTDQTWFAHLRYIDRAEPSGLSCQRYGIPSIDYFCVVEPTPVRPAFAQM